MASSHNAPVYVLLGATGGIGTAVAHRLADDGATLILGARTEREVDALVFQHVLRGLRLVQQALGLYPGLVVAGSVTLGLLILPIVIVASQEALRSVPDEFRQAASGLGASRWQTTRRVVLPEAFPGILTGTILAIGRAIGETAPLVMLSFATTTFSAPNGLLDDGTALPLQIFAAKANDIPEYRTGVVAAAAIVLLVLMLVLNATAILLRNRYQRDEQQ